MADATLVHPDVSRLKLERELAQWDAQAHIYRQRGWLLLEREDLAVEVAMHVAIPVRKTRLHVCAVCVRIDFANYDLWPPSLTFIDFVTRQPAPPPVAHAFLRGDYGSQNVLIDEHPLTRRPFFCVVGTREFHSHPQHSGDLWLVRRTSGHGSLATICERLWRAMASTVVGFGLDVVLGQDENADIMRLQQLQQRGRLVQALREQGV